MMGLSPRGHHCYNKSGIREGRMQISDTIIRTKLHPPFTRPGLISRPRLEEQIAHGLHGPLFLVTAPAGFGKTTLVAASVKHCGMAVAWLSLDRDDNQEGRFLTYLVAALQEADPAIGSEARQLMAGLQPAPPEAVLTSLINDLAAASGEIALILDDYQFISSQKVHEQVAFLLEHMPEKLHLVIASRSDPALPLARLRARGQMAELRAADLRFTADEAARFLNEVMGLRLDASSVAVLEERTEGWIAGLQMAALSMRGREDAAGFIAGFSGTNRYILDYLMEEVLSGQPAEIQRFLLHTSILERLTAPLCDAVVAVGQEGEERGGDSQPSALDARPMLAYLERTNLFLIPLDEERVWYRYHQLFADLLRARLLQAQPDLVPRLHLRASAWLEQNDFIPQAVRHLISAQEIDLAADLIERYTPTHWVAGDLGVLQMADRLPGEMLIERPKIGLYQAWYFILQGQIERALPLLFHLAESLGGADRHPDQRWIYTVVRLALAFLYARANPSDLYPLPDQQELEQIPDDEPVMRDAADILYGMAVGRYGDLDRAVEFSEKSLQRGKILDSGQPIPTLVPFLATMYLFQGRLRAAFSLSRQYLEPVKKKGLRISTAGNLDTVLGYALFQWNQLEEAKQHIREGLKANEPWKNIMTDAFGMLILINILLAQKNYTEAMQVVEQFEARLREPSRPSEFAEEYHTLRVRVQLASGNLVGASQWAEQIQDSEDFRLHPGHYKLTLARIRLAQGRYAEAEEILAEIAGQPAGADRTVRQLESKLLQAIAIAGQHRMPEALGHIETSLSLAEPEGYVRVFLDAGEPMKELLSAYLKLAEPACKQYAQKLLGMFPPSSKPGATRPQPAGMIEPLSERELEVLHLLSQGRTNREIAGQLIVAPGTVKAHTASIYRKLEVANRTEAVARARQLGILP
jgi:LuxR family maltose regulon positive regulatory protein